MGKSHLNSLFKVIHNLLPHLTFIYPLPPPRPKQGILASFFYKFADTILKKYSSTIATIFTAVMSYIMFGHELSINFLIGVSIVLISMHQVRMDINVGDKILCKPQTSSDLGMHTNKQLSSAILFLSLFHSLIFNSLSSEMSNNKLYIFYVTFYTIHLTRLPGTHPCSVLHIWGC